MSVLRFFPIRIYCLLLPLCFLFVLGGCIPKENIPLHSGLRPVKPVSSLPSLFPEIEESLEAAQSGVPPEVVGDDSEDSVEAVGASIDEPPMSPPEPEQTVAQEVKDLESLGKWEEGTSTKEAAAVITYDFPVTINRQVEYYLDFFQNKHRKTFERWLARSSRYLPMIQNELREAGLPQDLAYLAMIESGYNDGAYSKARAVGMWQFIKGTGRKYGLLINSNVDERRDPVKATKAAVSYLSDLYQEFDSWYLAVAGYNAGEGKIRRAIKKYDTTNFWDLAQGRFLKLETKRYVPKLIAAIILARDPEKYGFTDIEYQEPLAYDVVEVPRWTALRAVALAAEMDPEDLRLLNRELRKPFTPPDFSSYALKVPPGKKVQVEQNLPRVRAVVTTNFKTHKVREGESLTSVCRQYGLSKTVILKANNLRAAKLQAGHRLRIPFQTTDYELLPEGVNTPNRLVADSAGGDFILHKIRPGDTVSGLAKLYNVPAHLIAGWNDLQDISRIRAGQQLAIYVRRGEEPDAGVAPVLAKMENTEVVRPEVRKKKVVDGGSPDLENGPGTLATSAVAPGNATYYQVRRGDSLWTISKRFQVSIADIRRWNGLDKTTLIHPETNLVVGADAAAPAGKGEEGRSGKITYYQVRGGDSLWTIARRFNLTTDEIKQWNNLKTNLIHPGNRLLLKLEPDAGA